MTIGKGKQICGPISTSKLPHELIIEILSGLPPLPVVRCKCVCKQWRSVIEDRKFIKKHMDRGKKDWIVPVSESKFECLFMMDGLLIETGRESGNYRIRNHATNRILELPSPQEEQLLIDMAYVPSTNEYKVVFVYQIGETGIGVKVLTAGIDLQWRDVEFPFSAIFRTVQSTHPHDGIICVSNFDKPESGQSKVFLFQVEDESFKEILMPESIFHFDEFEFEIFDWDRMVALGCLVKESFYVWILVDSENSEWEEKRIVFSPEAIQQYPGMIDKDNFCPDYDGGNLLKLLIDDMEKRLIYDFENGKVVSVIDYAEDFQPSIVSLTGMQ